MENIQFVIQNQLGRIEYQINKNQTCINKAPDGKLYGQFRRNCFEYRYGINEAGNFKIRAIRNSDPLVEGLFKKDYYLQLNECLEKNAKACRRFLSDYKPHEAECVYQNLKPWKQALFEKYFRTDAEKIKAWKDEPYSQNPYKPDERCIASLSGDFVRSKSEREIANALYRNGIPFRTDCEFKYSRGVIYTDFIILHPRTMELYYWEHFGMLDDSHYSSNIGNRLSIYASEGIVAGDKLIITGETSKCVLSTQTIEETIARYFL